MFTSQIAEGREIQRDASQKKTKPKTQEHPTHTPRPAKNHRQLKRTATPLANLDILEENEVTLLSRKKGGLTRWTLSVYV